MARCWSRHRVVALFLAGTLFCLAAASLYREEEPRFGVGVVHFSGQPPRTFTYPLQVKNTAPRSGFVVDQEIFLGRWHPDLFALYPEDALWKIEVNGQAVAAPGLPLSVVHHEGRFVDLGPWLHAGANRVTLEMEAYWGDAAFHIYPAPTDRLSLLLAALMVLAAVTSGAFFVAALRIEISVEEAAILLGGYVLRWLYLQGTPHFVRAFDWWGHEAYLVYVARHPGLPDVPAGWENFQPPLYYWLLGGLTDALNVDGEARYAFWQGGGFALSVGVLLAGAWIARILYPRAMKLRLCLMAVLAVAPPLVFNASRVSNDALLGFIEFAWLGLLLSFWSRPDRWRWLGLCLVTGLALLTKANAMALVLVGLICLALLPRRQPPEKRMAAMSLLASCGAMAGWFYVLRASGQTGLDSFVVGNIHQLNPKGHIDGVLVKSLIFDPIEVLRFPFPDPWGVRRDYFPEYFFRSIFLGESPGPTYRWMARAYVLVALLTVPLVSLGLWRAIRARTGFDIPMVVTFAVIFLAQWTFLQVAPFTSSQDFRFSGLLLVPFTYFYGRGVARLPHEWRGAGFFVLQLLMLNAAVYLLEIALAG